MARKELTDVIQPSQGNKVSKEKTQVYSMFQALYLSLYSRKFYIDLIQRWQSFGFLYLLMICAIVSIPIAIYEGYKIETYYQHVVTPTLNKLPEIDIKQGQVQFDKPMPYIISDKENIPRIIIDTSGKYKNLEQKNLELVFLLVTNNSLFLKLNKMPAQQQTFPEDMTGKMTGEAIDIALTKVKKALYFTLYPSLISSIFMAELIILLIFASLAGVFTRIVLKFDLTFKQAIRLSFVIATPQLLAFIITYLLEWQSVYLGLLLFSVLFGYYVFAVMANKYAGKELVSR